jgi:hypothetical protein
MLGLAKPFKILGRSYRSVHACPIIISRHLFPIEPPEKISFSILPNVYRASEKSLSSNVTSPEFITILGLKASFVGLLLVDIL